ncbi:hypothetical protein EJ02DRAFT_513784 [Clathrospora elynae]|uniref:Zn(2)-C6 fungal-type domain-containing protein n=1 Tax=Clathrospora elynae TaxID=706981 RepID=A0A6A5SG01_9PLEO|nr:hypothetical protein EJ02DRAFT_513784 [Clathrospora elynae]
MAQAQGPEKVHAACDECRSRKLKCSGDLQTCLRCTREKIDCIYSPQKQMGRPRKRRRQGEADEPAELPAEEQNEHANILDPFSTISKFSEFGLISSAPPLPDACSSNGSAGLGAVTSHYAVTFPDPFVISPGSTLNYDIDPTLDSIDPSLWDLPPLAQSSNVSDPSVNSPNTDSCTCLSIMYLTLTELQAVPTFSFPQVIVPMRKAMSALSDLIHCDICPKEHFSAIQNVQSIVALFKAIVERFNKVLLGVDAEASQLEATGQKKPYRIGDNNPALFHLHTGTMDCPMGFNIELEAKDWRRIVKTVLKTEVYGGGSNPRPLLDLVKKSEARQERWHNNEGFCSEEWKQMYAGPHECDKAKSCEALGSHHIRRAIDRLKWD